MSENAMADTPLNQKFCTVPGYGECWVRFRTSGYPRKLRREWDEAKTGDSTLAIVLRYIEAASLVDLAGKPITPASVSDFDNVEDAVCVWLVREFQNFWLIELTAPRKNS